MSKNKIIILLLACFSFISNTYSQNSRLQGVGNLVDTDPTTTDIPERRVINIDKGFEGMMTIQIGVKLKPMEKYEISYGKNKKIIVINPDTIKQNGYKEDFFELKYPARKLQKRPVVIFVEKIESPKSVTNYLSSKNNFQTMNSGFLFFNN